MHSIMLRPLGCTLLQACAAGQAWAVWAWHEHGQAVMRARTRAHTHTHTHKHTQARAHTHTHARTHACTYTHTRTHPHTPPHTYTRLHPQHKLKPTHGCARAPAQETATRPWPDHWSGHVVIDVQRGVSKGCGDLLFSSHTIFMLTGGL